MPLYNAALCLFLLDGIEIGPDISSVNSYPCFAFLSPFLQRHFQNVGKGFLSSVRAIKRMERDVYNADLLKTRNSRRFKIKRKVFTNQRPNLRERPSDKNSVIDIVSRLNSFFDSRILR